MSNTVDCAPSSEAHLMCARAFAAFILWKDLNAGNRVDAVASLFQMEGQAAPEEGVILSDRILRDIGLVNT